MYKDDKWIVFDKFMTVLIRLKIMERYPKSSVVPLFSEVKDETV